MLMPIAPGDASSAPPPAGERIHEVRTGDTLSAIAKRYAVTVTALVNANKLAGADVKLKVGQRLKIPAATAASQRPARLRCRRQLHLRDQRAARTISR